MPPELKPDADHPAGDGPEFWQSVDQWMDSAKFRELMQNEFPEDADEWIDPISRRQVLQLMGASVALAGAVGCNPSLRPASQQKVVPYVVQPDQILPGVPLFFATAIPQAGGVGLGLLVKSTEGRPIKVEGNPNHPSSLGGTDVLSQASILGMYDPDRSKTVLVRGQAATYEKAIGELKKELESQKVNGGAAVRIVTDPATSPTLIRLIREFLQRFPSAKWIQYEPLARENEKQGAVAAFGKAVNPIYHLDKANVVLALDSDFLSGSGPNGPRYAREFAARRKVRTVHASLELKDGVKADEMNRLYAVESMVTGVGGAADHRLPLKPTEVELFARAVATKLGIAGVATGELPKVAETWITPLVDDLKKNSGKALVLVGDSQPVVVHQIAWAINQAIGAIGQTVTFTDPLDGQPADKPTDSFVEFKQLVDEMKAGKVDTLLLLNVNPIYDAPADLNFPEAFKKVRNVVHVGSHVDETANLAATHINAAHYLEAWGDVRAHDGTVTVQQPLMAPLFGGKTLIEIFASVLDAPQQAPLEAVQATWQKWFTESKQSGEFDLWWQRGVRDGVMAGTALPAVTLSAPKTAGLDKAPAKGTGLDVQFRADPTLYDGRFANNGWLQELPKPVSTLAWDNAAFVSPATAAKLECGVSFGWTGGERGRSEVNVVELKLKGRTLSKVAVWVLPGHADDSVTLYVGHGRKRAGRVGNNVGFPTYELRGTDALWLSSGLEAKKLSDTYRLAITQGHYTMESRRPYRFATVDQLKKDEDFAQIPPASAAEYKEIRALTPGTEEDWVRLYGKDGPKFPFHHEHEKHEGEHGDHRMIPLSLYPDYPQKVRKPDGTTDQASKAYRRWGMAIDLGACTGCMSCTIACVAENNIPVVGKDQVTRGRAMHWIRLDRYFSIPGDKTMSDELGGRDVGPKDRADRVKNSAAIKVHFQPVNCQQCEKAPCEVVCPVGATVHSADGLNDMAYNRCVGTRYCSNNCPYKVRRFNFIQYADYTTESLKLLNNPEVTVRTRGVMEKCTYCVQRIRNAEIETEREFEKRPKDSHGRPKIMDGEVLTACQSACPTGAIVFGDLNDTASQVLRWKAEPTNYGLLAELNTMPRTSYLAAIKNPNPELEKALAGAKGA